MIGFLRKKEEIHPEDELYRSAVSLDRGLIALKKVWVNSKVSGSVYCLEDLIIERDAKISGEIFCKNCIIKGTVKGDIFAWGHIIITPGATVTGNITTGSIKVALGSSIDCMISTQDDIAIPDFLLKIQQLSLGSHFDALREINDLLVSNSDKPVTKVPENSVKMPAVSANPVKAGNRQDKVEETAVALKVISKNTEEPVSSSSGWW